eukprot:GFUD01133967.1.p1 GENE.GFUD01133967.1~~GFUD01133967.1.p1  ORF type:complete len:408 (+),score=75.77 GFUD01133967.1:59-1282(+)
MRSKIHGVLFLIVIVFDSVTNATNPSEDVLRELHSKFAKYNKDLRPNIGEDPVTVGVSIYVLAVQDVSDTNMEFTLDIYFRQFWNDSRLSFEGNEAVDKIVFGSEKIEEIWKPDTFFVNEKSSSFTGPATDSDSFLRMGQAGNILMSKRMTVTAGCPMDFSRFPMDSHLCTLELESFAFSMADIHYVWQDGDNSVQLSQDVSLPNFKLLGHRQRDLELVVMSGNYSRLMMDLQFVRTSGGSKYFVPAGLLVAFSWLSFFVDHQKTMARLSLGMAPLFSIIFLEMKAIEEISPISYSTAIDIYMGFSSFIVLVSILVTVVLNVMEKRKDGKKKEEKIKDGKNNLYEACEGQEDAEVKAEEGHVQGCRWWYWIDCGCLVVLPVIFLVFNLAFWVIFGSGNEDVDNLIEL